MTKEWIDIKLRLPEPYEDVEVRAKGESTWCSYMYPNRTWKNGDKPTHWKHLSINKQNKSLGK